MLKSSIFFTFLLNLILLFSSFESFHTVYDDQIALEKIIFQNRDVEDSLQLQLNFNEINRQSTSNFKQKNQIIYQVLLANIYAQNYDKLNVKSELKN